MKAQLHMGFLVALPGTVAVLHYPNCIRATQAFQIWKRTDLAWFQK